MTELEKLGRRYRDVGNTFTWDFDARTVYQHGKEGGRAFCVIGASHMLDEIGLAITRQLNGTVDRIPEQKLPLGLRPHFLVLEERLAEVTDAMARYAADRKAIPDEWAKELHFLLADIANHRRQNEPRPE